MPRTRSLIPSLAHSLATLGPIGRLPKAPGTFGALAAVLCAPWLFVPLNLWLRLALLGLLFAVGGWAAGHSERLLGRKDPGQVVIDEVLGQWASILFLTQAKVWPLAAAFCLFRILDIAKPWPIKASETWLPGGPAVMLDDLLAGLMACAVLTLLLPLVP